MTSFRQHIASRKSAGLYRQLSKFNPAHIDFFSNDYLGYSRKLAAGHITPPSHPQGATGSRLLSGNHEAHEALELLLANYFGSESALFVHSGYQANLTVLSSVANRHDLFLYDAMVHASIHDGMRLSHARRFSFRHNDFDDLEYKLKKQLSGERVFVVCESLYSMSGNIADMNRLKELQQRYSFTLILDEAHAAGVLGTARKGLGFDYPGAFPGMIRIITFGKAFGYTGAAVLCDRETQEFLINYSRPFIYSTAPPVNAARAIAAIIQYHAAEVEQNDRLDQCINWYLHHVADSLPGIRLTRHKGPIQYLTVNEPEQIPAIGVRLAEAGLAVKAIRPPTVPSDQAGFRICLHAFNTAGDINRIFQPQLWASQTFEK